MAERPVFIPKTDGNSLVGSMPVEFEWFAGMSKPQKQKCIRSLHKAAKSSRGLGRILEISSKSEDELGIRLSAFNLKMEMKSGGSATVECLFQGSKVFSRGGPYVELYKKTSREAKKDERLRNSGHLVTFRYEGRDWPLEPQTLFYDWLYIRALHDNPELAEKLLDYDAFTDIEFNPKKSINCQASSAALYKTLVDRQSLKEAISSLDKFQEIHSGYQSEHRSVQQELKL